MMISNWKLYNLGTLWTRDSDQKISWFWSEFESSIYIIWYFSTAVNAQTLRSQVPQFEIGSISRWWNTYFECLIYPCLFDIRVTNLKIPIWWRPTIGSEHFWRNNRNGKVHFMDWSISLVSFPSAHPMGHWSAIFWGEYLNDPPLIYIGTKMSCMRVRKLELTHTKGTKILGMNFSPRKSPTHRTRKCFFKKEHVKISDVGKHHETSMIIIC